jgi:hypothetical protein
MGAPRLRPEDFFNLLGFPGGMNNVDPEQALPTDPNTGEQIFARSAKNVIFTNNGKFFSRPGYALQSALDEGSCLFSHEDFPYMLAREGDAIIAFDERISKQVVLSGLSDKPTSFWCHNGEILFTTEGERTGIIDDSLGVRPLGVPSGDPLSVSASTNGGLAAGRYSVAVSYLTNGEEGGVGPATVIEVADNGSILVDFALPPDGVDQIRVWCSEPNDDRLYMVEDVLAGIPSTVIEQGWRGHANETRMLQPLPAGHIIRSLNGVVLMAKDGLVYYTHPMRKLHHPSEGFVQYRERIDMLEVVGSSNDATIFIAAGKRVYRLVGSGDIRKFDQKMAYGHGAVPGTSAVFPGEVFGRDEEQVVYFIARNGIACLGLPGGQVVRLSEDRVVMPSYESGATGLRKDRGTVSVHSSLKGGAVSRLAIADSAEVFQYRNGIRVS